MTTLADRRKKFRAMLEERRAVLVPGAANALTARVIEDQGFEACYVTGAGIANTLLGGRTFTGTDKEAAATGFLIFGSWALEGTAPGTSSMSKR